MVENETAYSGDEFVAGKTVEEAAAERWCVAESGGEEDAHWSPAAG